MREYTMLSSYVPEEWEFIADIDESEIYEVDVAEIWRDQNGQFLLVTASGCSCWDGDYEVQEFESLDDLETMILNRDGRWIYNPSVLGARELVRKAHEKLEN